ncbi:hypothetical protein KUG33_19225, partial [Yersinia enterocolitica]|nr:hypothetical protein [Yersinia enterocolitica]
IGTHLDRNSLGGFHHGSGAIAPIKKPDIWLQYLSAIFKKKHLVYWERPYMAARAYMDVLTAFLRSACSLRSGHFVKCLNRA